MKILFTTFSYYPETSGVPIVVQYLAEGLSIKGHKVSVATRDNGNGFASHEVINGVDIYRFDIGQNIFKRNTGNVDEYISFIKGFQKEILILECLQCHTTDILLPYLHEMNCKIVLHTHGAPGLTMKPIEWEGDLLHTIGHFDNWRRWKTYYKSEFPKFSKDIDAGICLSLCASDIDYLNKHLKQVYIAENAANAMFFDRQMYAKDISSVINVKNSRFIVYISNYCHGKNQITLLKEFSKANVEDCALVLIGSERNSYCEKVIKMAKEIETNNNCEIKVLYNIDRTYFPAILNRAALFVMTSKLEQYPVSLVEAMAVGLPFISTRVGNAHILSGGVTARTNSEISTLLKTFLSNPTLIERLSRQGKDYANNNNTLKVVVDNYEQILLKVNEK